MAGAQSIGGSAPSAPAAETRGTSQIGPEFSPPTEKENTAPAPDAGGLPVQAPENGGSTSQPAPKAPAASTPPQTAAELPHDLSPRAMFMNADIVVKAVMIGLGLASLVTWIIWLAKSVELAASKARLRRAVGIIVAADSLAQVNDDFSRRGGVAALLVRAAQDEVGRSEEALDHAGNEGLLQRIASHLSRIEARASRRMSRGTGLLATIGSTAPFIGLFGTVWGIMNAFIGISQAQTTNLAVVAPGIAEALLATATGLVAAIPAVVIYNVFARSIGGYKHLLADASAGVERLVSRDLDFRHVPGRSGNRADNRKASQRDRLQFAAE